MKVKEYLDKIENLIETIPEDDYDIAIRELICLYEIANDVDLCLDYGILTREMIAEETGQVLVSTPSKYFWENVDDEKNTRTLEKFKIEDLKQLFAYVTHYILDEELGIKIEEYKEQENTN